MDAEHPIADKEIICYNLRSASYFRKIDLSDVYYQIELQEMQSNLRAKNSMVFKTTLAYVEPQNELVEKQLLAVKNPLRQKNFTINDKKSSSNRS